MHSRSILALREVDASNLCEHFILIRKGEADYGIAFSASAYGLESAAEPPSPLLLSLCLYEFPLGCSCTQSVLSDSNSVPLLDDFQFVMGTGIISRAYIHAHQGNLEELPSMQL